MRELSVDEIEQVSGGVGFVDSVATGSAVGATGYGGLTLAAGYSLSVVSASFTAGAAIGGIAGAFFFAGFEGATLAGASELGEVIGSTIAEATN